MSQTVKELHYHRNGIMGLGFYVAIVQDTAPEAGEMLVIRFVDGADEATGQVVCAAFSLPKLDERVIAFRSNSFRGDHFHEIMDEAIRKKSGGDK